MLFWAVSVPFIFNLVVGTAWFHGLLSFNLFSIWVLPCIISACSRALFKNLPVNGPFNILYWDFQRLLGMDRYQRVEKPRNDTPISQNEIRITTQGRMRNYISYGMSLLEVTCCDSIWALLSPVIKTKHWCCLIRYIYCWEVFAIWNYVK